MTNLLELHVYKLFKLTKFKVIHTFIIFFSYIVFLQNYIYIYIYKYSINYNRIK